MNPLSAEETTSAKRQKLVLLLREREELAQRVLAEIRPRAGSEPPPLSFAQQRLWFLDQLVPGSAFYNVPAAIRIHGPIDPEVLRATVNEIVGRHEVLRTAFSEVGGEPFQLILPQVDVPLRTVDLRHLPASVRDQEAFRLAEEDAQTPFDLRQVPLIRVGLVCLDESDYVLLINCHHIVADGWSMGVLTEEFRQIYAAFAAGLPSPLRALTIQYADFAAWQRRRFTSGSLSSQLDYWKKKLAGLPLLELPTDFPHRAVQGFEGETLFITFPLPLSQALKEFSRSRNVTLFTTLYAGLNALLHRYTGQDDIVIGEPIANRNRIEIESLIGFFVNSLVLRSDVSGDPTFVELLRRSRNLILDADANQDVPFEVLVEQLVPERSLGRNPLFQVSLQFFSGAERQSQYAVVSDDAIHVEKGTASLDLALDLIDSEAGLMARVEYSTELFRSETVRRLISHYQNLLKAFVQDPNLRISEAPMLSPGELDEIRSRCSSSRIAPTATCVHKLFEIQAEATPENIALESALEKHTYREVSHSARSLALKLQTVGVGPEKIVAICMDRSIEAIVGVLAVWMAGGAYLPLDPSQPAARLEWLLKDAKPQVILSSSKFEKLVSGLGVPYLYHDRELPSPAQADYAESDSGPENLAYVIYTSGSTGIPKGVMVEQGALADHLRWMQEEFPLTESDCGIFKYSLNFDVSLIEMFCPLLAGARVMVPNADAASDINVLAKMIRRHGVTVLDLVPSMLNALLDFPVFAAARELQRVTCGGEVMPADLLNRLLDRMDVEFCNMYGPTETTITATYWRYDGQKGVDPVPIGRSVGSSSAYVLDKYGNLVPALVPGELHIGGNSLARGYLSRPELTRERFVRNPFTRDPFGRLYRTGDRCRYLPNGHLEFLGRLDEQVKVRGHRIELGEVEAALTSCSLVRSGAAAVWEDSSGQNQLVGYVVPNTGAPELWPSVGEYFVYDELLYYAMTSDSVRTQAYRRAIEKTVQGRTVVDVGCGADLVLARMCLEAGAKRVYAIEMLSDAVERARRSVEELSARDRLIIIQGDSRQVDLPEKVDCCVSELIGTIGSSEGVIDLLNDARRFLKPGGEMIPSRCITRIAAVSLPDELMIDPHFGEIPGFYAERIFESYGRRFDIRVCVKNLPGNALVSTAGVFEDLWFHDRIAPEGSAVVELIVRRKARLDGFLLWIDLAVDADEHIDVLSSETSWLPIFLPVFSPSIEVEEGDTITGICSRLVERGEFTPDYLIRGTVSRGGQIVAEFDYGTSRNETSYGANAFYQALLEPGAARSRSDCGEAERVRNWERLYERIYEDTQPGVDPTFNVVGWNSSYTGLPLGEAELGEQVEATVQRIRQLGGRRILEIGCGTGLLLFRLAESCERYVACDFSPRVVEAVRRECQRRGWEQVEVWECQADDFSVVAGEAFDVVVLNSVVQYFPGMDYLLRVLDGAVRAVRGQGWVFVGDVRSLPLLRWLHAGIELASASDHTTAQQVRERLERRWHQEQELVIDPEFFSIWAATQTAIGDVKLEIRRGWHHNELTKFRYDVVLEVGPDRPPVPRWEQRSWEEFGSLTVWAAYLRDQRPAAVRLHQVPSARLASDRRLMELLEHPQAELTAERLRQASTAAAGRGVEPEALWALAHEKRYRVRVNWDDSPGCDGCYEAWFIAHDPDTHPWGWRMPAQPTPKPWSTYANEMLGHTTHQQLAQQLREHLRARLPDYMVPAQFVWMERLPVTPNGKLNRQALPAPGPHQDPASTYIAPRGELEEQIATIWSEILGIDRISVETNFFIAGGHSLLATQVVSRLGEALQMEVPLRLIFEWPTISGLAEAVKALPMNANVTYFSAIRR